MMYLGALIQRNSLQRERIPLITSCCDPLEQLDEFSTSLSRAE
jgi:hypothetical protein